MMTKLADKLSGTHITILIGLALFVPSALWGAATFTTVAITDGAGSGRSAGVTSSNRLAVADSILEMASTPANYVVIHHESGSSTNYCKPVYTVPAGKAFILESMTSPIYTINTASSETTSVVLYRNAPTYLCGTYLAVATSTLKYETVPQTFGHGIALPEGTQLGAEYKNNGGSLFLYGYLVPAAFVPASSVAPAAGAAQKPI